MLSDVKIRAIILFVAFILDLLIGDPRSLPHPVVLMGKLIGSTEDILRRILSLGDGREEDKNRKIIAGILLFIIVTGISVLVPAFILIGAERVNRYLNYTLQVYFCAQLLAVKSLFSETMKVYRALAGNDIQGARLAVSMLVGRDTDKLDKEGIIRAAVETVAENTSDGIVAPIFYMVLLGLPGIFLYKAVNTLDSMVGYKNERYLYLGRCGARMDDIFNFIPARISGFIMVWVSGLCGHNAEESLRIFLRDRKNHSSPNSAHTEAAMAGALGISLGGDAWYFGRLYKKPVIGDNTRDCDPSDIRRACKIMLVTSVLFWLVSLLVLLIWGRIQG